MAQKYCYWSVCDGPYAQMMAGCVDSARRAGVFKEFHVFTDRPIEGCECYDAQTIEKTGALFKLIYLKAGVNKLLFDYFIWIDADSRFTRSPNRVLEVLSRSPIHVPLISNVSELNEEITVDGLSNFRYIELMKKAGVLNPVYSASTAFWVVKREAIEHVCQLAYDFLATARNEGLDLDANSAPGCATPMLCANPGAHWQEARPDLWASDDRRVFQDRSANAQAHIDRGHPSDRITPAIVHLPCCKARHGTQAPPVA